MKSKLLRISLLLGTFLLPLLLLAQDAPAEKGFDQRIDEAFAPIADVVNRIVFFEIPLVRPAFLSSWYCW
jgi:hypothetical protein